MPRCDYCCDLTDNLCRVYDESGNSRQACRYCLCAAPSAACAGCGCQTQLSELSSTRSPAADLSLIRVCGECLTDANNSCEHCGTEGCTLVEGPGGMLICDRCYNDSVFCCRNCRTCCFTEDGQGRYCMRCARRGEWDDGGFFTENPTYSEIRSTRKYGVEFETSSNPDHTSIQRDTVFGCKKDGSVDGMEFVSPVLYGDEGLVEIRKLSHHASRLGWEVDSACGFHLHVDLSNDSDEDRFKLLYSYMYTYDFWSRFISRARKENYYCAKHVFTVNDIENGYTNFHEWVEYMPSGPYERYDWVNWRAFLRFKTVELRNHSATLNGEKACNWIKAHTRFIDNVVMHDKADIIQMLGGATVYDQFKIISEWWDDEDLSEFYLHRAELFRKPIRNEMVLI